MSTAEQQQKQQDKRNPFGNQNSMSKTYQQQRSCGEILRSEEGATDKRKTKSHRKVPVNLDEPLASYKVPPYAMTTESLPAKPARTAQKLVAVAGGERQSSDSAANVPKVRQQQQK